MLATKGRDPDLNISTWLRDRVGEIYVSWAKGRTLAFNISTWLTDRGEIYVSY